VQLLGAERIGHGINAIRDPALVEYLAKHQIPLEVCPTSNVRTRSVPSLAEHPLPALVAAGVPVSINSDDPPMFGTSLGQEYAVAAELLDLAEDGLAELARAGVRQSFADEATQRRILGEIDAYAGSWIG
jgi:aminodeoxyfutalosine deaminase